MSCAICGSRCAVAQTRHAETCDRVAYGLRALRLLLELRARNEFGVRSFMDALRSKPTSKGDKLCPFCRKGRVTRSSLRVLYIDAVLRAAGMARSASHTARHGRGAMIEAFVDGGDAKPRTRATTAAPPDSGSTDGRRVDVADWS